MNVLLNYFDKNLDEDKFKPIILSNPNINERIGKNSIY